MQFSILLYDFVKNGVNWNTLANFTFILYVSCLHLITILKEELKDLGLWLIIGSGGITYVVLICVARKQQQVTQMAHKKYNIWTDTAEAA